MMPHHSGRRVALAAAALLLCCATSLRATPAAASVDDVVGQPVDPHELEGKVFERHGSAQFLIWPWRHPLLVVSWSADDAACMQTVVPAALELQERFSGDLVVILAERSGKSRLEMLQLAADKGWLCSDALWTTGALNHTDTGQVPSFVLTAPNWKAVLAGDPVADRPALLDAIVAAVAERRHGAAGLPSEARDAWSALAAGEFIRALGVRDAANRHRAKGDAATADVLDKQAELIEWEILNRSSEDDDLLRSGAADEGMRLSLARAKQLHALPLGDKLRTSAEGDVTGWQCGDRNEELEASAAVSKLLERLCSKGRSAALAGAFKRVAKDHDGTNAAKRALDLAAIAAPP